MLRPFVEEQQADRIADEIRAGTSGLDAQIAGVDGRQLSPDLAATVKETLQRRARADEAATADAQKQSADKAWSIALDPAATSLRAIPPMLYAALAPGEQDAIRQAISANARMEDPVPDPALYLALAGRAARGELTVNDTRRAWGRLPRDEWVMVDGWRSGVAEHGAFLDAGAIPRQIRNGIDSTDLDEKLGETDIVETLPTDLRKDTHLSFGSVPATGLGQDIFTASERDVPLATPDASDATFRFRRDAVTGEIIPLNHGNDLPEFAPSIVKINAGRVRTPPSWPIAKKIGDVQFQIFPDGVEIFPLVRLKTEPFTDTAIDAIKRLDLDVAINGAQFEFPNEKIPMSTYARATVGAIDPNETRTIGLVIRNGHVVAGRSSKETYYFAKRAHSKEAHRFEFGQGDPPNDSIAGFGGAIPLIVNGVRYGPDNRYNGLPAADVGVAPERGNPGRFAGHLTQRSNAGYKKFVEKYEAGGVTTTGKVVVAYSSKTRRFAVAVQPDGAERGRSLAAIREIFARSGFDNVLAYDGSSSATLVSGRGVLSHPGDIKNSTIGTGIGIRASGKDRPH